MGRAITCDLCNANEADLLISNTHTGDTMGVCTPCLPSWAAATLTALTPEPPGSEDDEVAFDPVSALGDLDEDAALGLSAAVATATAAEEVGPADPPASPRERPSGAQGSQESPTTATAPAAPDAADSS